MKLIIDRFEGEYAVCEKGNREMIDIPKKDIPSEAKEGDVLIVDGKIITIDHESTKKRKQEIAELSKGLWK
jgi:Cft2 family RNA processing exonuclease